MRRWERLREHSNTLLFLGPCMAILLLFSIFPLIYSLSLSFHSWEWVVGGDWEYNAGANYVRAVYDERFIGDLGHTLVMCTAVIIIELLVGLGIALVLDREIRGSRIFRTLFLLPMMIAPVAVAFTFSVILHEDRGPLNYLLLEAGLPFIPWLSKNPFATLSIILITIWQGVPLVALLLLAGLQSLPISVTEQAEIDGASGWRLLRYVKLPMLRMVMAVAILLRLIEVFKLFDVPFVLTRGGPGTSTELLVQFVYYQAFKFFSMGYAAATSFILLVIVIIVVLQFVRLVVREARI
ncbi:carbohydrate ABC transporter permease [[Eubacterium] cellulosolvens]